VVSRRFVAAVIDPQLR